MILMIAAALLFLAGYLFRWAVEPDRPVVPEPSADHRLDAIRAAAGTAHRITDELLNSSVHR